MACPTGECLQALHCVWLGNASRRLQSLIERLPRAPVHLDILVFGTFLIHPTPFPFPKSCIRPYHNIYLAVRDG